MGKILMPSVGSSVDFDSVTAVAADILSGKIAIGSDGELLTGTMTDRGVWTSSPTSSGKVTIPAGYHNGSGYVNTSGVYNAGYNIGYSDGLEDGESNSTSSAYATYFTYTSDASYTKTFTSDSTSGRAGVCLKIPVPSSMSYPVLVAAFYGGRWACRTSSTIMMHDSNTHNITNTSNFTFSSSYVELPSYTSSSQTWTVFIAGY